MTKQDVVYSVALRETQKSLCKEGVRYAGQPLNAPVAVDVHIVPSTEAPTGVGESPVPVIAPAVANALARLTGKRYRVLPLLTL